MTLSTELYEEAFQARPGDYTAIADAMDFLTGSGRQDLLQPWLERAIALDPLRSETLYHLALTHELTGDFSAAVSTWRQLLELHPDIDPYGLGLARALLGNMELPQALTVCETALQKLKTHAPFASPLFTRHSYTHQFHIIASEILLRMGDVRGFAYILAQTQVRCPSYQSPQIPVWTREPLVGRHLIVTSAGGYGDQFLFAALLPQLLTFDCRITFVVHPDLQGLFTEALSGVRIIAEPMASTLQQPPSAALLAQLADDPPELQATLWHLPLMRLILAPQHRITFPAYLRTPEPARHAAENELAKLRYVANGRQLVGITWDRLQRHYPEITGAVEAARTARTSLPPELLHTITDASAVAEQVHFVALHECDRRQGWPDPMPCNLSVISIPPGDFAYTAAIIDACSLVLSVDMSVANLAAMMGRQTWLMLAHESDWRWGITPTSPWIAGTRTFRQPVSGDWDTVVAEITQALTTNTKASLSA